MPTVTIGSTVTSHVFGQTTWGMTTPDLGLGVTFAAVDADITANIPVDATIDQVTLFLNAKTTTTNDPTPPTVVQGVAYLNGALINGTVGASSTSSSYTGTYVDPWPSVASNRVVDVGLDRAGFDAATFGVTFLATEGTPPDGFQSAVEIGSPNATPGIYFEVIYTASPVTDPPAAPTLATVTPISATQIDLAWTDNSSGASQEDGFKVYRKSVITYPTETTEAPSISWSLVTTTAANATSYSDTTVSGGKFYAYSIQAYNSFGSAFSNVIHGLSFPPTASYGGTQFVAGSPPVGYDAVDYINFVENTGSLLPTGGGSTAIVSQVHLYRADAPDPGGTTYALIGSVVPDSGATELVQDDNLFVLWDTIYTKGRLQSMPVVGNADTGYYRFRLQNASGQTWGTETLFVGWFFLWTPSEDPPIEVTFTMPDDSGWWLATDNQFSGAASTVDDSIPADPRSFDEITSFATASAVHLGGFPGPCCVSQNRLIFAKGGYSVGTDSPSIYISTGITHRELCRVPKVAGTPAKAVMSMLSANGTVYVSTLDSGTSSADWRGRVFSLDIESGVLTPLGTQFAAGHVPYALAWHNSKLWCGTNRQVATSTGKIYWFRPSIDTTWTEDRDLTSDSVGGATSMWSYAGKLYVGTSAPAATFATVEVRDSLGAWTTSTTASGGTAAANNCILAMSDFSDNLYASFWNPDTPNVAKVYKFDGSTWTTAYTGASGTLRPFVALPKDTGILLALGGGKGFTACLVSTADGTTWTDRSANLPQGTDTSTGLPCWGVIKV